MSDVTEDVISISNYKNGQVVGPQFQFNITKYSVKRPMYSQITQKFALVYGDNSSNVFQHQTKYNKATGNEEHRNFVDRHNHAGYMFGVFHKKDKINRYLITNHKKSEKHIFKVAERGHFGYAKNSVCQTEITHGHEGDEDTMFHSDAKTGKIETEYDDEFQMMVNRHCCYY